MPHYKTKGAQLCICKHVPNLQRIHKDKLYLTPALHCKIPQSASPSSKILQILIEKAKCVFTKLKNVFTYQHRNSGWITYIHTHTHKINLL